MKILKPISFLATPLALMSFCVYMTSASADINPPDLIVSSNADIKTTSKDNNSLNKPRGQLLYENHCHVCHEKSVHSRQNRKAHSITDIYYWVNRWKTELKLKWSAEDIEEVVEYLNATYYHHPEE